MFGVANCTILDLRTRISEMLSLPPSTYAVLLVLEDSHGRKLSNNSLSLIGAQVLPQDSIRVSLDSIVLTIGLPVVDEEDAADTERLQLFSVKRFLSFLLLSSNVVLIFSLLVISIDNCFSTDPSDLFRCWPVARACAIGASSVVARFR